MPTDSAPAAEGRAQAPPNFWNPCIYAETHTTKFGTVIKLGESFHRVQHTPAL